VKQFAGFTDLVPKANECSKPSSGSDLQEVLYEDPQGGFACLRVNKSSLQQIQGSKTIGLTFDIK